MDAELPRWQQSRDAAAAHGMMIAVHAALAPDRSAIVAATGTRTFGELNAHANQLVRGLRERGLERKSSVALICSNRAEFMEVHAACMRAGFILTPVNWHLRADEIAYIVANCEAKAVIAETRFSAAATHAVERSAHVQVKLSIGGQIDGFDDYAKFTRIQDGSNIDTPSLGSPMLYTSGTTGHPKGVYRWPPRVSSMTRGLMGQMLTFEPGKDLSLLTGPAYHAAPLNLNAVTSLHAGVGLVMMDKWDAEETLRLIQEHKIVYTHLVATMFTRMLRLPEEVRNRYDLSSLKAVIHGAAPCPLHVKQAMIDWLGPVLFEYYAATEGGATLASSADWLARPGTVGKPIEGAHMRILDADKQDLAAGTQGTVYVRSPPEGGFVYFKSDEKTANSYHDNYFTMGDHGFFDADGYLFLTGRDAELIISGGVNIYPQEIDDVLMQLPVVHDSCTIGVPDEEWGEAVKAIVELVPGTIADDALAAELLAHCKASIAGFKCPRSIEFQADLPRLPSGKIQRHKVRAPYWPTQAV